MFVGTRVPAQSLIDYLAAGDSLDKFLDAFPSVTRAQAVAALDLGSRSPADGCAFSSMSRCHGRWPPRCSGHDVQTVVQIGLGRPSEWRAAAPSHCSRLWGTGHHGPQFGVSAEPSPRPTSASIVLVARDNRVETVIPLAAAILAVLGASAPRFGSARRRFRVNFEVQRSPRSRVFRRGSSFIAFLRRAIAQPFARPLVERASDQGAVVLRDVGEFCRFGAYWRTSPLVFSLVPRSHAWCGVAK